MKAIQIDPHGMASLDLVGFIGFDRPNLGPNIGPFRKFKTS